MSLFFKKFQISYRKNDELLVVLLVVIIAVLAKS